MLKYKETGEAGFHDYDPLPSTHFTIYEFRNIQITLYPLQNPLQPKKLQFEYRWAAFSHSLTHAKGVGIIIQDQNSKRRILS